MFDFVQKHQKAVTVVLGMVAVGLLVGAGVSGYSAFNEPYLAKVGNHKITSQELAELSEGQNLPDALKPMLLEQLVRKHLVLQEAASQHLLVTDDQLRDVIRTFAPFQENGQFSPERYKQLLSSRQMSPAMFEAKLRDDILTQSLIGPLAASEFQSKTQTARMNALFAEERTVSVASLPAAAAESRVSVSAAEIKQYYDANRISFKVPERAKLEYLKFSIDDVAQGIQVSDDKIKAFYDEHQKELSKEERQASHILIAVNAKAGAEEKAKAKAKAESILAQVKANPSRFAELAKAESQDPGSASKGGDLGFFGRGVMAAPFENAVFSLAKGQLSSVVETQFGFHIIRLDDVKGKGFADVKADIALQLKKQEAASVFASKREAFSDVLYNKADSLADAAKEFKLTVQQTAGWINRSGSEDPVFGNEKLREAVFIDDVLVKKHNSEAVEIAPGVLIAARATAYEPEAIQALPQVTAQIEQLLKKRKAAELVEKDGAAALASLQKGNAVALNWKSGEKLSRINKTVGPDVLKPVFAMPATKLPAYAGVKTAEGYAIYRLDQVGSATLSSEQLAEIQQQSIQARGQMVLAAFMKSLEKNHAVEIRQKTAEE